MDIVNLKRRANKKLGKWVFGPEELMVAKGVSGRRRQRRGDTKMEGKVLLNFFFDSENLEFNN